MRLREVTLPAMNKGVFERIDFEAMDLGVSLQSQYQCLLRARLVVKRTSNELEMRQTCPI